MTATGIRHNHDYDPSCVERRVNGHLVGACISPLDLKLIPDSGRREAVSTGAVRERAPGKGLFVLISPIALRRLALRLEDGDTKYKEAGGGRNWEKGQPLSWYLDGAIRHLGQWQEGYTDEDHLAAALWNVHCLLHTEEMIRRGLLPAELDDVPHYLPAVPENAEPVRPGPPLLELGIHESYAHHDGRCYRRADKSTSWRDVVTDRVCPHTHDFDQRD